MLQAAKNVGKNEIEARVNHWFSTNGSACAHG